MPSPTSVIAQTSRADLFEGRGRVGRRGSVGRVGPEATPVNEPPLSTAARSARLAGATVISVVRARDLSSPRRCRPRSGVVSPKPPHRSLGVVATSVEPPVHDPLDPASERAGRARRRRASKARRERCHRSVTAPRGRWSSSIGRGVGHHEDPEIEPVGERAADEPVDVVQVVSQDRDPDGQRDERSGEREEGEADFVHGMVRRDRRRTDDHRARVPRDSRPGRAISACCRVCVRVGRAVTGSPWKARATRKTTSVDRMKRIGRRAGLRGGPAPNSKGFWTSGISCSGPGWRQAEHHTERGGERPEEPHEPGPTAGFGDARWERGSRSRTAGS